MDDELKWFNSLIPFEDFRTPQPTTLRLQLRIVQLWF